MQQPDLESREMQPLADEIIQELNELEEEQTDSDDEWHFLIRNECKENRN